MTRINLVPVRELSDQHLFAEFREIKMVPRSLARSLRARGTYGVRRMIPDRFTLGRGHVSFFYNKGAYLARRYDEIRAELARRGINYDRRSQLDPDGVLLLWMNDYTPTPEALETVRARIAERLAKRPHWYRWSGNDVRAA